MSVFARRNRLVTFRLTDQEFELVRRACAEQGVRSVSEFARSAVLRQVAHHGVTFAEDLNTLSVRLQELDGGLRDASARIRKLLGTRQSLNKHNEE